MADKNRQIYVIISIFIGIGYVSLTLLAMLYYPENFSFLYDDFSLLGRIRTEGNLANPISPILFLLATGSSGISLILFWVQFRLKFFDNSKYLALSGSILGVISSISLIGVGLFPVDLLPILHGIVAVLFFVGNAVAFLLYSIAIFRHPNFNNLDAYIAMGYVIMAFLYIFGVFFSISPLIQKICVYYFIFWCELQNRHILT